MKKDSYYTIRQPEKAEINVKRSRFIAYAYPVSSAEEALMYVKETGKEHHAATHVCWAYAIDPQFLEVRSQDDGEPSGTAGKPILSRLIARDITATLILVVRYFGGVKLGTSGLIEAYREAAEEVLKKVEPQEIILNDEVEIAFAPHLTGEVMRVVKKEEASISAEDFCEEYLLTLKQRSSRMPNLVEALRGIYGVRVLGDEQES